MRACVRAGRGRGTMNNQERALRIMRAIYDEGFREAIDLDALDGILARTIDVRSRRAFRNWRFYLESKGYLEKTKGRIRLLHFPVSLELETFNTEEEEER